jgi:hypothetical protein
MRTFRILMSLAGALAWIGACSGDEGNAGTPSAGSGGGGATASSSSATTSSAGGAGGTSVDGAAGGGGTVSGDACGGPVLSTQADTHCASPDGGRGDAVPPHEGTEADDDNCYFHVKMTVPCIEQNQNVAFTFELVNFGTTTPANGAAPELEATIGYHPSVPTNPMATENNGVYTITPVRFDRAGRWTVTLHVYDAMPAKHSHVSFYVDVP